MTIPALEARTLLNGLVMGESPRWWNGRLWVCDWGARELLTVDMAGCRETIVAVDALPFCIDPRPDDRLLISAAGQVLLLAPHRQLKSHADLSSLSDKPWNEIVVVASGKGRGNAYVNNIGFDFPHGEVTTGIIALVTPDGAARQVADGVAFPNGMAITPDGETLILAESYGQCLTAFDIMPDGGLSNRRIWAEVDGHPDGICLDAEGAVWYADVPGRRCVRVAEGGAVLARVDVDRGCFSCALGGPDGTTLFIVAADWRGPQGMGQPSRTGVVLTARAPAPAAARSYG
ncbi:gluconolaconase [Caulobacter sp. Root487D2Y]|uniref:SMP-30/gluconolactonase/LRE family protein n=1 Tax=Caulobacter sp. Root487D2Y TaxID=1736547 RepID=UPI0006FD8AFF|nr:SMP-30/gluconolactonase/LRE family protein [Caulobacter sp. Root487D2Y]KQY36039.1 gluconolaconase [Caulobacter sp. Root487D2Y]